MRALKVRTVHIWYHYNDRYEEKTEATQLSSQEAVAAADLVDGAVTERRHFPLNVNRTGYIVFSVSRYSLMKST